jgi:hypothetical protein
MTAEPACGQAGYAVMRVDYSSSLRSFANTL